MAAQRVKARAASDEEFRKQLAASGSVTTEVATDPQVFERITLGLYREPASALRELVSNSYDADATEIRITMHPPFFDKIEIEDDGIGMSETAIAYLVHHVGGTLKRSERGSAAGVTRSVGVSPGGRKLIGQMGIGLYSVARLTRHLTVESKQEDASYRFFVDLDLSGLDADQVQPAGGERYVAGFAKVERQRVHPAEVNKHYTRIVLHDVLEDARHILRSSDRWDLLRSNAPRQKGELKYHIGRAEPKTEAVLPWAPGASPLQKFKKLVDALSTQSEAAAASPSIDKTLDYYLAMLWKISLSAPLKYVERHPFSLTADDGIDFYSLGGDSTPEKIEDLPPGIKIGPYLGISEEGAPPIPFSIYIDGIELRRPIVFQKFAADPRRLLPRPKMFVGDFTSTREGADLRLTGYFFWSYAIIPKENNGILARIAGASGTLFDPQFLGFRTSENLRLRQVSAEAFIDHGLENALNVDRESFVQTDPSVRQLEYWVHRSMTRLFSRLKADQKAVAYDKKGQEETREAEILLQTAARMWSHRRNAPRAKPPEIVFSSSEEPPSSLPPDTLFIGGLPNKKKGGVESDIVFSARLKAALWVLDAHRLLDGLTEEERWLLVSDLSRAMDF